MRFCPKCSAYWEATEESCRRCGAPLAASGRVDSSPPVNQTLVRILAILCLACGLVAAYFGLMTGGMLAGLAAMMRDPSLGFLIILGPVAVGLPFFIVSFFLFRARSWARRAFVVLLTLVLAPLAAIFGGEVGLEGAPPFDLGASFALLAATLIVAITPWARKAFGKPAGLWWLEAGLAALPVLALFSMRMSESRSIRLEVEREGQQAERNVEEFIKLLQEPESQETDARIGQLISVGAYSYVKGSREMPPLSVVAKNHPRVVKALLDAGEGPLDPLVWKNLAEGGHFDLLPDLARAGIRPDPKVAVQFGVELIRMIREDRSEPGYRERVTGLILGGADLTVSDRGRTALEEAARSGQTEIEDQLREQMKLPARSQ